MVGNYFRSYFLPILFVCERWLPEKGQINFVSWDDLTTTHDQHKRHAKPNQNTYPRLDDSAYLSERQIKPYVGRWYYPTIMKRIFGSFSLLNLATFARATICNNVDTLRVLFG